LCVVVNFYCFDWKFLGSVCHRLYHHLNRCSTHTHIIHTSHTHITHTFFSTPRGIVITQYFARNITSRYTNFFALALHVCVLCTCMCVRGTTIQMMIKTMTDRPQKLPIKTIKIHHHTQTYTHTHAHTFVIIASILRPRGTHITLSSNCYIRSRRRHIESAFNACNPMT